jgi:hypothetical protein
MKRKKRNPHKNISTVTFCRIELGSPKQAEGHLLNVLSNYIRQLDGKFAVKSRWGETPS